MLAVTTPKKYFGQNWAHKRSQPFVVCSLVWSFSSETVHRISLIFCMKLVSSKGEYPGQNFLYFPLPRNSNNLNSSLFFAAFLVRKRAQAELSVTVLSKIKMEKKAREA